MKKLRISLLLLFSFIFMPKAFSQGVMIVEDLTAIATAISNGYTMYQQLVNNIEQLKSTYEQLDNTRKQMESFDWTSGEGGLNAVDNFMHATDSFMSLQDRMSDLVNSKNMQIGDWSFSLKDMYSTDGFFNLMTQTEKKLDPRNISEEDQKKFIGRHGLSVDHYMKFINLEKQIATKSQETEIVAEEGRNTVKAVKESIKDLPLETDGEKAAMDVQNAQLKAQTNIALVEVENSSRTLETVQNIAQHILEEHKISFETVAGSTEALEEVTKTYSGDYFVKHDNENYLHLWNWSWSSNKKK